MLYSFHIGTLVVIQNRPVIDDQGHVRLVVAKDIIVKGLAFRNFFRQKQCLPNWRQQVTLFESTSGKSSVTSCLKSRHIFFCLMEECSNS